MASLDLRIPSLALVWGSSHGRARQLLMDRENVEIDEIAPEAADLAGARHSWVLSAPDLTLEMGLCDASARLGHARSNDASVGDAAPPELGDPNPSDVTLSLHSRRASVAWGSDAWAWELAVARVDARVAAGPGFPAAQTEADDPRLLTVVGLRKQGRFLADFEAGAEVVGAVDFEAGAEVVGAADFEAGAEVVGAADFEAGAGTADVPLSTP
ncbi:hypothetical protein H632_c3576p0, partial [Helicosporidium sp. ATCC 50920]